MHTCQCLATGNESYAIFNKRKKNRMDINATMLIWKEWDVLKNRDRDQIYHIVFSVSEEADGERDTGWLQPSLLQTLWFCMNKQNKDRQWYIFLNAQAVCCVILSNYIFSCLEYGRCVPGITACIWFVKEV